MNTEPRKLTRQSLSGQEYQFEYIPSPIRAERGGVHTAVTEYRIRRGGYGTYTRWFKTRDIGNTIRSFGFTSAPSLMGDFTFEATLGRGEIFLPKKIVSKLANAAGMNPQATHLYSRLKRAGNDSWVLPSSAVVDQQAYMYMKELIRKTQ